MAYRMLLSETDALFLALTKPSVNQQGSPHVAQLSADIHVHVALDTINTVLIYILYIDGASRYIRE